MSYGVEIKGQQRVQQTSYFKIHVGAFRYPLEKYMNLITDKRHYCILSRPLASPSGHGHENMAGTEN